MVPGAAPGRRRDVELAYRSWEDWELRLSGSEMESLRFLLYRVLEEPGAAPDTRELRENILKKLEAAI